MIHTVILFAVDTNVFIEHTNYATLIDRINKDLGSIAEWLKDNKLSLNINKKKLSSNDISINGVILDRVSHTKWVLFQKIILNISS